MKEFTPYLEFDALGITRVGCMKCNRTVALRSEDGRKLLHMTHSKRLPVILQDGSEAALIVCSDCILSIMDEDIDVLEKTMKWGHRVELEWKLTQSGKLADKKATQIYKDSFQVRDDEPIIPLRVSRKMLEGKAITRRK